MTKSEKYRKILLIYKIYMLVYLLCAFNAFINGLGFMKLATVAAAAFGGILLIGLLIQWKQYLKMGNLLLLFLFMVSYLFSSIMNIRYGVTENIQAMVWMACQMGLLYLTAYTYTAEQMRRELKILAGVGTTICTVFNLIGFSTIFWLFDSDYRDMAGGLHAAGYRLGRLWGTYDDPNHGAVISVIAIFFALYLWKYCKRKYQKVLLVLSIIIQYLYIGFANSRTAMIALGGGLCVGVFLALYAEKKKALVRSAAVGILVMLASVSGLLLIEPVNEGAYAYIYEVKNTPQEPSKNTPQEPSKKPAQSQREKELAQDGSNGRIALWESGLEIVASSPVYGVSYRNITPYAEANLPDTYIVNNNVVDYDSLHNMFVDVLASQGLIGLAITVLLIVNTLRILIKGAGHLLIGEADVMVFSFSMAVAMLLASMFYTYVFYLHAPQTYIFWLCMGYMVSLCQHARERERRGSE